MALIFTPMTYVLWIYYLKKNVFFNVYPSFKKKFLHHFDSCSHQGILA